MNTSLLCVITIGVATCFVNADESQFVTELSRLAEQRDKAIATATEPIQKKYVDLAQQLLIRATKAGDYDAVLKIKAALETEVSKSPPQGVPSDAKQFKGKWYKVYIGKPTSWSAAKNKCQANKGQLAVIPDEATWTFIKQLSGDLDLWLGATDEKVEGVWTWVDGTPLTFNAWNRGGPSNSDNVQHYLHTQKPGWDDIDKDGEGKVIGYICEWNGKP